jgi:nitrite reductase/ring-hydroxylating ferredoxin subunit
VSHEKISDPCALDCPLASVDRRTFLTRAMFSAAAVALAACGGGDATSPFTGTYTLTLADYPALAAVGGVALVSANGASLAVVRTSASSFAALSRVCPHEGATVNTSSSGFLCPRHGAQFDKNGTWIGGQRTSSMHGYATTYDASAGTLTIG